MIWLNPWAWLGAAFVAAPIVIHLLSRGNTRVERFPSLRFLDASRLLPTRRTRLTDIPLLLIRAAILLAAAAALAHPLLLTTGRRGAVDGGIARVVILDTSASMRPALTSARLRTDSLVKSAEVGVIVETAEPSGAIAGSVAWLEQRAMPGELAIVSDFQVGTIEATDLARVPQSVGIRTSRVAIAGQDSVVVRSTQSGAIMRATARASGDATDFSWIRDSSGAPVTAVPLLGTSADAGMLDATTRAASTLGVPLPVDSSRRLAIAFGGARLRPLGNDASIDRLLSTHPGITDAGTDSAGRLTIVTNAKPGTLDAARLATDAARARSLAPMGAELEPDIVGDAELQRWNRTASTAPNNNATRLNREGPSDARWLWGIVLALMLIETFVRRAPRAVRTVDSIDEARHAA